MKQGVIKTLLRAQTEIEELKREVGELRRTQKKLQDQLVVMLVQIPDILLWAKVNEQTPHKKRISETALRRRYRALYAETRRKP